MTSGLAACFGGDLFTEEDHQVVFSKLQALDPLASCALYLHFWWAIDWTRIAALYETDMKVLSHIVSDAFSVLRESCIRDPRFSRYEAAPLMIGTV